MSSISVLELFGQIKKKMNLLVVHELKSMKVGPKQAVILRHICRCGTSSNAEIGRATSTDPAAVGRAVDSLLKKGWVRRREHPQDRRRWILELTKKGHHQMKMLFKIHERLGNRMTRSLNEREKNQLKIIFEKISNSLNERSHH